MAEWFNVQSVPQTHTFPPKIRPGNDPIPTCKEIPIIDLTSKDAVQKIIEASQEYGLFLVSNHGVSEDVIGETMKVLEELFSLPQDDLSKDAEANGWIFMGSAGVVADGAHLWRDNMKHPCHPLEDCIKNWPQKPIRYREVMAAYVVEVRRLSATILEMICEGLGLEKEYLGRMSQVKFLTANRYPPCPDPRLALGLLKHYDHSLITILYQGNIEGLQILKDGRWIGVKATLNSFVVNIGTQVQIISNGKLRSLEHRAVPNPDKTRISLATFVNPSPESIIAPAKTLVNEDDPARYPAVSFEEFVNASKPFGPHTHVIQNQVHANPQS